MQRWLDYLEVRPDVDPHRIAVYGEGAGASHASRLALSDRRIAAAVCDGWLLGPRRFARHRSLDNRCRAGGPLTTARRGNSDGASRIHARFSWWSGAARWCGNRTPSNCKPAIGRPGPLLGRHAEPRSAQPLGEVENFVAVDDFVLEWLDASSGPARQLDPRDLSLASGYRRSATACMVRPPIIRLHPRLLDQDTSIASKRAASRAFLAMLQAQRSGRQGLLVEFVEHGRVQGELSLG